MTIKTSTWPQVQLRKVLTYIDELVELDDNTEYTTITVKRHHGGLEAREKIFGSQIRTKKQFKLIPGAFIISRVQCWHQAYAIVPDTITPNIIASTNYDQFMLSPEVDKRFFWWFSHSPIFTETVRSCAFGVVIEKMVFNRDRWLDQTIPLPPLEDQHRIVAQIEELAARIEEARGLRREAYATIGALRASAMNALFSSGESARWPTLTLGEVSDIQSGVTLGRMLNGPKITLPYLRVANVQDGYLDLSIMKEVDILVAEFEKWQLMSGDILLTEGGDWDKLGRGAVWRGEISNCIHQNHIFRVRVNTKDFDPDYLVALISSPYGKTYFRGASKQTTNLATINQRQLRAFRVFKPPLSEQKHILTYLDALQSKVNCLKQLQSETSAELDALLPSILDKAFKGEL